LTFPSPRKPADRWAREKLARRAGAVSQTLHGENGDLKCNFFQPLLPYQLYSSVDQGSREAASGAVQQNQSLGQPKGSKSAPPQRRVLVLLVKYGFPVEHMEGFKNFLKNFSAWMVNKV